MIEDLKPLTSLRFFAAMMIVVLHMDVYLQAHPLGPVRPSLVSGVSFFFVLSGFILTHVYTSRPAPFGVFIQARIARLWPNTILALLLLIFLFPGMVGTPFHDATGWDSPSLTAVAQGLLLQSFIPDMKYYLGWNSPAWSISTEFGFYLAFPLLLISIRRTWHWKIVGCAAMTLAFIAYSSASGADYAFHYVFPPVRLVEFSIGMGGWVIWDRYVRHAELSTAAWSAIEAAAVTATVIWIAFVPLQYLANAHFNYTLRNMAPGLPAAPLLIALASGRGLIGRMLSHGTMLFLGKISFALYVFHLVIIKMIFYYTWKFSFELVGAELTATFLVALFAASTLLYLCWERPMRSLICNIGKRRDPMPDYPGRPLRA